MKYRELNLGILPEDKGPGVKWNIQEDTLRFIIKMNDKQVARRVVLAALSTAYEPLGLGSPFLLKGRLIIQSLWKNSSIWGEPIDDNTAQEWFKWRNNMMMMDGKSIA